MQQPFEFGYLSMIDMIKVINGDKSCLPADGKVIVPTRVIDKSNVAEFITYVKTLLQQVAAIATAPASARRRGRSPGRGRLADTLLELAGITKTYPGVMALDNVSLRVMPRRGAGADRRERRRQIDADEDPGRRRRADRRHDPHRRARASRR